MWGWVLVASLACFATKLAGWRTTTRQANRSGFRGADQRPMVRCRKVQIRAFIQACWALSAAPPWPPSVFSQ